jgi:bleomycin hydrolase
MLKSLINKYGIVPKSEMVENFNANNTSTLNKILNTYLRKCAFFLREKAKQKDLRTLLSQVEKFTSNIYNLLTVCLGTPPGTVRWEYYTDKSLEYKSHSETLTPQQFYEEIVKKCYDVNSKICLVNVDSKDREFYKFYNIKYVGNVVTETGTDGTNFFNVPMNLMTESIRLSVDEGEAVWFGSDVNHYMSRKFGIMDQESLRYDVLFGEEIEWLDRECSECEKYDRLRYYSASIEHAMVIKGYHFQNEEIVKWDIENSWGGTQSREKGYGDLTASKEWFDAYVYEAVVSKEYIRDAAQILSKEERRKVLQALEKKETVELEPWDRFGNLM